MMRALLCLIPLLLLSACAGNAPPPPEGFAVYEKSNGNESRAVTPEGVTWRVRTEDHKPQADLSFWQAALRKRMSEAGYRVVDSLQFQSSGKPGFAWEFAAPQGPTDFSFLVGVVPDGSILRIVEVAGPLVDFAKYRARVVAQLQKLVQ